MSENLPENQPNKAPNEEVDLIVLFNLIGNAFSKFFNFIGHLFKLIFSFLVFILKAIITNFKLIAVVLIISGVIGFALERTQPIKYESKMLVKPYFDSKFQLINNIDYFNSLLASKDYTSFKNVFNISEDDAKQIQKIEIGMGPENENDKIRQYDEYLKSFDSIRAQDISYTDFIENRNIYSTALYEIKVIALKQDIFKQLEEGFVKSFENEYAKTVKEKRDSLIQIQKTSILNSLETVKELQEVYVTVLLEESKGGNNKFSLGETLSLETSNSKTKEFELLGREIYLRGELRLLDEQKIEEDVYFDTVASFQESGNIHSEITQKYILVFPFGSFLILCLIFVARRTVKFIKNYDA